MGIASGTVIDGKIVVEGLSLREGDVVTVMTHDDEDAALEEWQHAELQAAAAELDRGEFVTLEALLASLPKRG